MGPPSGSGGQPGGGPPPGPKKLPPFVMSEIKGMDRNNAIEDLEDLAERALFKKEDYSTMTADEKNTFMEKTMKQYLKEATIEKNTEMERFGPYSEDVEYRALFSKIIKGKQYFHN
jgi:hypothetical protein